MPAASDKVTDQIEARVLARTTERKPADGSTHWSSRKLASELGHISHMTVTRIWAKQGIKPHRLEGYIASNDPEFETKAADVIGLYLNPNRTVVAAVLYGRFLNGPFSSGCSRERKWTRPDSSPATTICAVA
jgi:hypothetical protein